MKPLTVPWASSLEPFGCQLALTYCRAEVYTETRLKLTRPITGPAKPKLLEALEVGLLGLDPY
jgi:hypothetical protein